MVEQMSKHTEEAMIPLLTSYVHDINNLCTCIFGNLGAARYAISSPTIAQQHIDNANIATAKAMELSELLLKIIHGHTLEKEYCDLHTLLTDSVKIARPVLNVQLALLCPEEPCIVYVNPVCISSIILSILINISKTFVNIQKIIINGCNIVNHDYDDTANQYVQIQISTEKNDTLPQRTPFTNKLKTLVSAILHKIVDIHNGTLSIDYENDMFKKIILELPIVGYVFKNPY